MKDIKQDLLTFNNPYINSLDGVNFMIDGVAIRDILAVLKKIMYIKNGQKDGDKIVGPYLFNQEKLSISQLAKIEPQNQNNSNLSAVLEVAKQDFIQSNQHFFKNIEPVKKLLLSLIQEFCERRNRNDSLLLTWTQARNGQEAKVFQKAICSFKDFDIFLQDLTYFLKDLVNSCPKAREQYKEWYKTNKLFKEL